MARGTGFTDPETRLLEVQRDRTPWFWKPQRYWFGRGTLLPFMVGHDEYARRTIVVGWTVTGRIIFPLWDCGDPVCRREAMQALLDEEE